MRKPTSARPSSRPSFSGNRPAAVLLAAVLTAAAASVVHALDEAALVIEAVNGAGWSAQGILVRFELPQQRALLQVERLRFGATSQELRDVRIDCPQLELSGDSIACPNARVAAQWPALGEQALNASIRYGRSDGALDVAIDGLQLEQGTVAAKASLRDSGWQADAQVKDAPVELLLELAQALQVSMPSLSASGRVSLAASARGLQGRLDEASVDAALSELTANNDSGSLASDKLALNLQATVRRAQEGLRFSAQLHSQQGQAYAQPIFLDFTAHALRVSAQGRLNLSTREAHIERFQLDHAEVARAGGNAVLALADPQPLRSLQLQLDALEFPGAYTSYFQPLLLETSFKSLETAGGISGTIVVAEGSPQSVHLRFDDVTVDDGSRNLALTALRGEWYWRSEAESDADAEDDDAAPIVLPPSRLAWSDGVLLGLELGASELHLLTRGRQVRLLEPARIPVLDGAIALESFRIRNAGMPSVAFMVDATIEPISMQQLCRSFGWPEFGGRIGGVISKLRMREGVITLGTTLEAQVFDGSVTLRDLRLEQPFGQWPRFYSSIALDDLDLELLTSAFSFGRITGRLSGAIDGLQLFNWTPTAFDARLYTPPDDRSRHRISQRAVENIGSIGGGGAGVAAALSSGFMRFFDDFNYERLGLSCRLQNDVCVMDGVAPAAQGGYYLVKGKGVPRIDVIGNSRHVDWPRLVRQLIAVTQSEGPVVQ
jgi:hypothetical protein